jgi:hypothetical protein
VTNLNVQISNSLYKQIEALAVKENVPVDQLVAIALSAWAAPYYYIEAKKARGSWDKFKQVLNKVPDIEPRDYDTPKRQ